MGLRHIKQRKSHRLMVFNDLLSLIKNLRIIDLRETIMGRVLYIIGNGFDKAHGLPSGYWDFRAWLDVHNKELLADIEDIWDNNSELWSDFEKALGIVDYRAVEQKYRDYRLIEHCEANRKLREIHPEIPPAEHHAIEEKLEPIVKRIRLAFNEWVKTLNQSIETYRPILNLDTSAFYITFNYTETLEILYNMNKECILHIHGRANSSEEIMFGHDKPGKQIQFEIEDFHLKCPAAALEDFSLWIGTLRKNVDYNLFKHSPVLTSNIISIESIYILGYSFSEIDAVYIDNIFKRTYSSEPMWNISYYTERDKEKIMAFIRDYHIRQDKYRLLKISEM